MELKELTTFGVGGVIDQLHRLGAARTDVSAFLQAGQQGHGHLLVLGGGSNILAHDAGYRGPVVWLSDDDAIQVERGGMVVAFAGASLQRLVAICVLNGWTGIEMLAGIPGTVGGAVYQNAGAYGQQIGDCVVDVEGARVATSEPVLFHGQDCRFGYRSSRFQDADDPIIIQTVRFRFRASSFTAVSREDLRKTLRLIGFDGSFDRVPTSVASDAVRATRTAKDHVVDDHRRSAGSFFKNPPVQSDAPDLENCEVLFTEIRQRLLKAAPNWNAPISLVDTTGQRFFASSLIAAACFEKRGWILAPRSMRGRVRIGAAGANVLMNGGGVSAAEVRSLASTMRDCCEEVFGVSLEPEVKILDEFGPALL